MVNRSAVILRYKEPFIKWVNEADPYVENPGIDLESTNEDCTVFLITEEDGENLEKWISLNFEALFESELEDWYTDESLWPEDRSRKVFDEWFSFECHSMIIDTVGGEIVDDEV